MRVKYHDKHKGWTLGLIVGLLLVIFTSTIVASGSVQFSAVDLNGDGQVNGLDAKILLRSYGLGGSTVTADINQNGKVESLDATVVAGSFQTFVSPSPGATVTPIPTGGGNGLSPVKIGTGAYPDLAVDNLGNLHVVWASSGKLVYKKYTAATGTWSAEQDTTIAQNASYRNDPDIVVDSQNRPHVIGGLGNGGGRYAYWNGSSWISVGTFNRDTSIAIDNDDTVYVSERGDTSQFIKVSRKLAGGSSFTALNNPAVTAENDHVYTDIAASLVDNSLHIVYRHATVTAKCSAVSSTNGGSTWTITGINGDDSEAPSVTVAKNGKVFASCGNGSVFEKSGSGWSALGRAVTAGSRSLPIVSTDSSNNLYVSAFGGRYNVRAGTNWSGEKIMQGISSKAKGFARVAGSPVAVGAHIVWEEGNSVAENDSTVSNFDIVVASVNTAGVIGGR